MAATLPDIPSYAALLRQLKETGVKAQLQRERSASLIADAQRIVSAARAESVSFEPRLASFPVAALLRAIEDEFRPQAQVKGLAFRAVPCGMQVTSDPDALASILENLAGNAVKYTD